MKMEVGKVYRLRGWSGVAICLEYAPNLQFKHAHLFQKQMNKNIDPIDT
jgi:hypothetical protein